MRKLCSALARLDLTSVRIVVRPSGGPKRATSWLLALVASLVAAPTLAHPGGLDANGCHTNHKTGDYHCHRAQPVYVPSPAPTQSQAPVGLLNATQLKPATKPNAGSSISIMTRDSILAAEFLLLGLRYNPGQPDGVITEDTRKAVSAFQRDSGLPEDGDLTGAVLVKLAEAVRWKLK